jgi:hypothetical protein
LAKKFRPLSRDFFHGGELRSLIFFHECTRINTNVLIRGISLSWERSAFGSEIKVKRNFYHGWTRIYTDVMEGGLGRDRSQD